MAGLGAAMQGQAPAPEEEPEAEANVTPEEQAQYERFVRKGYSVLYPENADGQVAPEVLANLKGDFDKEALQLFVAAEPALTNSPQDSASASSVIITILVENSLGEEVPDEIVMHGGKAILEDLIEISEAAKIHDFTPEEIEGAWYRAIDLYRVASPRADPDSLAKGFEMVMAADAAGKLDDVMTGKINNEVLPGLPGGAPMQQQGQQPQPEQQQGAA